MGLFPNYKIIMGWHLLVHHNFYKPVFALIPHDRTKVPLRFYLDYTVLHGT